MIFFNKQTNDWYVAHWYPEKKQPNYRIEFVGIGKIQLIQKRRKKKKKKNWNLNQISRWETESEIAS